MKNLVLVAAQVNLFVGDIEGNTQLIIDISNRAYYENQADIVLFPELAITSYPPEDLLFRPSLYQRVHQALKRIIKEIKYPIVIVVGYPDYQGGCYYNKAAVISKHKVIATYNKRALPNYQVFDEKRYFSSGNQLCVIEIRKIKIGLLICEDLWIESPLEDTVKAGAQLIACINASPFTKNKSRHRYDLLEKRTKKYHVPIIYLNLIGGQDELIFDGGSMIFNQNGYCIQQGAYFKEELMTVEINLKHWLDVQPVVSSELLDEEKIYNALVLGVRDYINKNNFPSAIIGLSGGVDSALTLAIAVDAIGSSRVSGVLMPSLFTSSTSIEDAQLEAEALKISTSTIDINPIFETFLRSLSSEFSGFPRDLTEENLQARIRGTLLMALSNKKGAIVLSTGNKSELSVGYTTLYGDTIGGISVLKDIYKTMVYRLCKYRNTLSPIIPKHVLMRAPSAELALNQKDQDTLPPYSVLDEILERYIEQNEDTNTIATTIGVNIKTINQVIQMVNRNEYKRRQTPIGIRITECAFGKDRRYPITSRFSKNF
ncbi:NAD+ synthase [Coxiella endosymbiont of Amblyomma americanum]|uniref:NAD+ synthase n=1 Tax=Coxiella endosymbiont of Amblyomma americanum TaxID=325775 RepID=UPI00057C470B|nr:NAD+ synthase [Coxiella endosymbiont of Amblyomma americanum]AJC50554.1 NAD synthetase [Coxiella endosymbiont of Amblyomma americanum]AUJ58888.1 NAD+ synthase [Coxiella-like endosymbiont of Amblyomma americanum]